MQLPIVTGQYRAVDDAELRFSPSGVAVSRVRAVASSRKFNKETQEWEDADKFWVNITAFKKLAENTAESVVKGTLINVIGRIRTEEWEDKDGNKRSSAAIIADTISLALDFDPAKPMRAERAASRAQDPGGGEDPWAAGPHEASSEPPF